MKYHKKCIHWKGRERLRIKDNVVLDLILNSKEQAELLKCFLTNNEQILFPFKESWLV